MLKSTVSFAALDAAQGTHVPTEELDGEIAFALWGMFAEGHVIPEPSCRAAGSDAEGIELIAGAGAGKTAAVAYVLSRTPGLIDPVTGECRYVKMQAPHVATPKQLCLGILEATGVLWSDKAATASTILAAVQSQFATRRTAVLWIDESQNLIDGRSEREIKALREILTALMRGPSAVIVILSGTKGLASCTPNDPEFSKRFTRITPPDLKPGVDDGWIHSILRHQAMEFDLEMSLSQAFSRRLIEVCCGRYGRTLQAINKAIEIAVQRGHTRLSTGHFMEALGICRA